VTSANYTKNTRRWDEADVPGRLAAVVNELTTMSAERSGTRSKLVLGERVVDEAIEPALAGLGGRDNRVSARTRMFVRMAVRR
jgi:hypothetical protein